VPDAAADQLRPILTQWHEVALPRIRTKDFGESWTDFVVAWERVRRPAGATLYGAVAAAETVVLQGMARSYTGHLRRWRRCVPLYKHRARTGRFPCHAE
jgi:hypothetical protein